MVHIQKEEADAEEPLPQRMTTVLRDAKSRAELQRQQCDEGQGPGPGLRALVMSLHPGFPLRL